MRFNLIDLIFAIIAIAIGAAISTALLPPLSPILLTSAKIVGGVVVYLIAVYPVYRFCKLYPLILPRCPCCNQFQQGFHFMQGWPRVTYRCPTCNGEFVIWHNGKPTEEETWDKPVLALKWPYAWGRYVRMKKPEQGGPGYPPQGVGSPDP